MVARIPVQKRRCVSLVHEVVDQEDVLPTDPPFFSDEGYEILWHDGYEVRAFEDRWMGGIQNYIVWMRPKLEECFGVLKKTGSTCISIQSK
ncbi:MAG: hypothetical protein JRN54_00625 [Nitrososphaerota archaeon]|nr:hypothetical protein [Nitrososphaerota archaeon]MDG6969600.1 hypothetical protein [Nitrososphaerota archaeon]